MTLALFYDTETTGLPLFKLPSEHPDQPHIVQLAAALVYLETRTVINSIDVVIKPDGWAIPKEVSAIHGITTEHAAEVGIPEALALEMLLSLWMGNRLRIAHNEPFDARIVRIACMRHADLEAKADGQALPSEVWKGGAAECTAQMSSPILQLPPTPKMVAAGFTKFKTPNLGEAYRHFTGLELENAHSAMADVNACIEVYFGALDAAVSA